MNESTANTIPETAFRPPGEAEAKAMGLDPAAIRAAAEALRNTPVTIAGVTLRKVVARDLQILRELKSPFILAIHSRCGIQASQEDVVCDIDAAFDAIFLLSVPCREASAILAKGAAHYHEVAADRIGDLTMRAVYHLIQGVAFQLAASFFRVN